MATQLPPPIDPRLNDAQREGLTGATPGSTYARGPERDPDELTSPPDGRPREVQPQWRRDFPIDWPQDEYVSRRDFSKFMVLTSLAFAAGQLWVVARRWWRRTRGREPMVKIARRAELAIGETRVFNYPAQHDNCVLVRLAEDEFVAYSQKCTHLSCAVIPRPEQGVIHCPCHEGYFDLRTGREIQGPPPRPLPRVLLEVRDGDIYAVGVESRAG